MLEDLYHLMISIIENIDDDSFLGSVGYCPDDRDCGYRSSLKHLNISRSSKTDAVANHVIYKRHEAIPPHLLSDNPVQIELPF